jgi:crotonobetainyl-CoA:carnitine CoA-transferase CaiB-like acyl-CoA transferase
LEPADIWCAKVLDYETLIQENGYQTLNMELKVRTSNGLLITTTRCPIRIDGEIFASDIGAPLLGEHNELIDEQFGLKKHPISNYEM